MYCHPIRPFDLSIASGVCHRRIANLGPDLIAVVLESTTGELSFVVRDYAVWTTKPYYQSSYELNCCCGGDLSDRFGLDPLSEFVDGHEQKFNTTYGFGEWFHDIKPPESKRPREWYGL